MSAISDQAKDVTLQEWDTKIVKGAFLTPADKQLVQSLRVLKNSHIECEEILDGLRIQTTSWVGVLRFQNLEIKVLPKLAGENLDLVRMIEYTMGLSAAEEKNASRSIHFEGDNLFELIVRMFIDSCEKVAQRGLISDYQQLEGYIPVLRGRLNARKQFLEKYVMVNQLYCNYDEHISDIPENQIILAALTICLKRISDTASGIRLRKILEIFSCVCSLDKINLEQIRSTLVYNRTNEHYRVCHSWAWLILDSLGVNDLFAGGSQRCFAFFLDMNLLFQNFVSRWLTEILQGRDFNIHLQKKNKSIIWNIDKDNSHSSVIPDILVESRNLSGVCLPIDVKYKAYDEKRLATPDLYQVFMYAYAYGEKHKNCPSALIIYPATSSEKCSMRLAVRQNDINLATARLQTVGIHIPSVLNEAYSSSGALTEKICRLIEECLPLRKLDRSTTIRLWRSS